MNRELEEMRERARVEGFAIGLAEGKTQGLAEGMNSFAQLVQFLFSNGRLDDLQKAVSDSQFRLHLMKELGI